MKPVRIANADARIHVQRRNEFTGSNLYARKATPPHQNTTLYVVYSYGTHFPIYIAESFVDQTTGDVNVQWYQNTDKFSMSTSRHQSQANPHCMCVPMTAAAMRRIARDGIAGLAAKGEME